MMLFVLVMKTKPQTDIKFSRSPINVIIDGRDLLSCLSKLGSRTL